MKVSLQRTFSGLPNLGKRSICALCGLLHRTPEWPPLTSYQSRAKPFLTVADDQNLYSRLRRCTPATARQV